jgi:N12 class adenine-specific DNA methylase
MAGNNLFIQDPLDRALGVPAPRDRSQPLVAPSQRTAPASRAPVGSPDFSRDLSARHGLPLNIVEAMAETAANEGALDAQALDVAASSIRSALDAGADMRTALTAVGGRDRAQAVASRALQIAQARSPEGIEAEANRNNNGAVEDVARSGAAGVATGTGMALQGAGRMIGGQEVNDSGSFIERATNLVNLPARAIGALFRGAGNVAQAGGDAVMSGISDTGQQAMQESQFGGDLFKPETWTFGENPSLRGVTLLAANVLGNLAPVVAAGIFTGGAGAAVVGGAQSGEGGAQTARQLLEQAAASGDLQRESEYYQSLIANGASPEDATRRTIEAGESMAALMTAPIGAFGGALTSAIVKRGASGAAAGGLARRVTTGAALGAAEESVQEAAEGVAARLGGQIGSDVGLDPTANTFGDMLMGMMAGGPIGALGGIPRGPQEEAPPPPLGLPSPDQFALPPPDAPQGAAPQGPVPGPMGTPPEEYDPVTGEVLPPALPPDPRGPLEQAASMMNPPAPEAAPPAVRFPDMKPGQEVELRDPDGRNIPVVFLREEGDEVVVRDMGQELRIPAADFDVARVAAQTEPDQKPTSPQVPATSPQVTTPSPELIAEVIAASKPKPAPAPAAAPLPVVQTQGVKPVHTPGLPPTVDATLSEIAWVREQGPRGSGGLNAMTDRLDRLTRHLTKLQAQETSVAPLPPVPDVAQPSPAAIAAPEQPTAPALPPPQSQPEAIAAPEAPATQAPGQVAEVAEVAAPAPLAETDPAYPGYKRRKVGSEYSTTMDRMTDDGYIATRTPTTTTLTSPTGKVLMTTDAKWGEADIGAAIGEDRASTYWHDATPQQRESLAVKAQLGGRAAVVRVSRAEWDKLGKAERAALVNADQDRRDSAKSGTAAPTVPTSTAVDDSAAPNPDAKPDPNPTEAQKEAGNYKMGHITWNGLDVTIETAKGQERRGKDKDGEEWSVTMPADYGYIRGTKGKDGDHVDVYVVGGAENPDSWIWVIDQYDPETGRFDEHKVILGGISEKASLAVYDAGFSDGSGPRRRKGKSVFTVVQFKGWLENGDQTKPAATVTNDDLAKWEKAARGASEPAPAAAPTGPRVLVNVIGKDGLTDAERAAGKPSLADPEPAKPALSIKDIRDKAAVLMGMPESTPPVVGNIGFKWEKAAGGWLFSRARKDEVIKALGIGEAAPAAKPAPETDKAKAIRLFKEIVRSGDATALAKARQMLVRMLGAPAVDLIEAEAKPAPVPTTSATVALVIKELRSGKESILYNNLPNGMRAEVNDDGTQLWRADGIMVVASSRQYTQAEIEAMARGEKVERPAAPKPDDKFKQIGTNDEGNPLFEDDRGVRSFTEKGVRVTEAVGVVPTRDGVMATGAIPSNRSGNYLTEAERAEKAAEPKPRPNPPTAEAFDAIGMTEGKAEPGARFITQDMPSGVTYSYKVRPIWNSAQERWEWATTRDVRPGKNTANVNNLTPPPTKNLGRFNTADEAIAAMRADGLSDKATAAVLPPPPVKLPSGFIQTYLKPMRKQESALLSYPDGTHKAVIVRQSPYNSIDGYGPTPNEALEDAARKARAVVAKEQDRKPTPQAPPMAGMSPLGAKPAETAAPAQSADDILNAAFDDVFGEEAAPAPVSQDPAPDVTRPAADLPAFVEEAFDNQIKKAKDRVQRLKAAGGIKLSAAENTLRMMRRDVFQAQEAAAEALAAGDMAPFATFADLFSDAADAIQDAMPAPTAAPMSQPAAPNVTRSAGEAAKSAVANVAQGMTDMVDGFNALFGDPNKLSSGLTFDRETYEKAKPLFIAAVRAFGKAGQDIMDIAKAMVRGLAANGLQRQAQENMRPYLSQFIEDVRSGAIDPFAPSELPKDTPSDMVTPPKEAAENDRLGPDSTDGDERSQPEGIPPNAGTGSRRGSGKGNRSGDPRSLSTDPARNDSGLQDAGRTGDRSRETGGNRNDAAPSRPLNHRIPLGGLNDTRGEKTRAKDSIDAIRLLKSIEAQQRRATPEEQTRLALYAGAGSLNPAVPNSDGSVRSGWESLAADLSSLVTKDEMATIAKTTQYAFYTSEEIVRSIWSAVQRLGFKGGTVFEPGMGIGHFLGMSPDSLVGKMTYRGLELDSITARIARQLYPESTVQNADYTQAGTPTDFFDLAIGNPPFANIPITSDKKYPQRFLLHDYFFAKTLDAVRPGGLLAFITSEGTMNKMDPDARRYLADRADLVGAIRLPNTAFKNNAGTEVTTDVILLRKRVEGDPVGDQSWLDVDMVSLPSLEGGRFTEFKVNRYFVQNPDMILGDHGGFGTQRFRGQYAVIPRPGQNLAEDFADAVKKLPADVMTDANFDPTAAQDAVDPESGQTKAGSFYIKNGALWQFDGNVGRAVKRREGRSGGGMTAAVYEKAKAFVGIRDALRDTYAADLGGTKKEAAEARARLNAAYDAFVAKHGPINKSVTTYKRPSNKASLERFRAIQREEALEAGQKWDEGSFDPTPFIDASMTEDVPDDGDAPTGPVAGQQAAAAKRYTWTAIAKMRSETRDRLGDNYRDGSFNMDDVPDTESVKRDNLEAIMDDPEVWRIASLEKYDNVTGEAEKTQVFTGSVLARQTAPEIRDVKDALNYSMAMRGRVDLDMIASSVGISPDAAIAQLDGLIFRDPVSGRYENRDTYLSGNVRTKLEQARAAGGPEMEPNIRALQSVMPRDLTEFEVTATLGMPWIPIDVVRDFAKSEIGVTVSVERTTAGGRWLTTGDKDSTESTVTWGTGDVNFPDLLEKILNRVVIKVSRTTKLPNGSTETRLDEAATQAANEKADQIKAKFADWVWKDDARKERLLQIYNVKSNSTVAPSVDGSYLTTPGIAAHWGWRPHQLAAIARILQMGSTYLAHAVGAGKTSEMIAAAMEARRLGIARKPMFAVPNHMLGQFAAEFYDHYPTANITVADDRKFQGDNRRRFIADAQANDYDAIILTHSSFQKIPVSDALNDEFVQAEIERFDEAIRTARDSGDRITTKEMERAKEKLEQRLRGARDTSRVDTQLTFEEMGVDMLFIDEAHLFRKLDFATQLGALKGVTPSGSQMSWDLFLKTRHLERVNPGRGIVLASGTPITNTMAELFTISRYIQHDTLAAQGLLDFDSWAQSFGETSIDYEPDAAGNYKAVSRFSKFVNTRDLSLMVRERMDTVIAEDLAKYVVRPALKDGSRTAVPVPRSPAVAAYQGELAARMKAIEERKGPPKKGDDNHLVIIGDGIAAATDMRLINPAAPGGDSKLTKLAENVTRIWKETANIEFYEADRATHAYKKKVAFKGAAAQMIFADVQRRPGLSPFDTHLYIRDYLIKNGVPSEQIVLFRSLKNNEAKRRVFRQVNSGEVRILIGSAKQMGTGVNAQQRLKALHNLDPHWYPALDEQRVGRILRQGNMNPEIEVYDYATEGTYDSTMWQMMGRKARTIEDFMRGDPNVNEMEDVGPASVFEQLAGLTTPDPRILRLKQLQEDVKKLERRRSNAAGERRSLQNLITWNDRDRDYSKKQRLAHEAVLPKVVDLRGDGFKVMVGDKEVTDRKEFGEALADIVKDWSEGAIRPRLKVGAVNGVAFYLEESPETNRRDAFFSVQVPSGKDKTEYIQARFVLDFSRKIERGFLLYENPVDTAKALSATISSIPTNIDYYGKKEAEATAEGEKNRAALAKFAGFTDGDKLEAMTGELRALLDQLDSEEAARIAGPKAKPADVAAPAPKDAEEMRMEDDGGPAPRELRMSGTATREVSLDDVAGMIGDIRKEVAKTGLAGKVSVRVVRRLADRAGIPIQGRQRGNVIEVNPAAPDGVIGVMRHEIIHALRDSALWNSDYGLFTAEEWRGMVRAARADKALMAELETRYAGKKLTPAQMIEEGVAEQYRLWAKGNDGAGPLSKAFGKIRAFFTALANAFRGRGYQSAGMTFQRIADGEIGGRGPSGPGGRGAGRTDGADMRGPEVKIGRDNPGGSWLARKVAIAEEEMKTAPISSARRRGIVGPSTAYTKEAIMMPVAALAKLKGASGEVRKPGDPRYDELAADVAENGWQDDQRGNAVLVEINHLGQAYMTEGNTRVAVAAANGVPFIRADVRWLNGGEDLDGDLTPAKVKAMAYSERREAELRAYHGSRADFDRFSTEFMGTGEGAQAFGWGMYFAGRKELAKWYKDKLSRAIINAEGEDISNWTHDAVYESVYEYTPANFSENEASDTALGVTAWLKGVHNVEPKPNTKDGIVWGAMKDAGWKVGSGGRLYEVEIPDDSDLMDWDAPFAEQSQKVKAAFASLGIERQKPRMEWIQRGTDYHLNFINELGRKSSFGSYFRKSPTGGWDIYRNGRYAGAILSDSLAGPAATAEKADMEAAFQRMIDTWPNKGGTTGNDAYAALANRLSGASGGNGWSQTGSYSKNADQAASLALRDAGIPGHRFLDGASRADGDGSRNYVIYDDAAVEIVGKELRMPTDPEAQPRDEAGRFTKATSWVRDLALNTKNWRPDKDFFSNFLTDSMGANDKRINLLALVPLRPLLSEVGRGIHNARKYLAIKDEMDSIRQEWFAKADKTAREWVRLNGAGGRTANTSMMDLMHRATLSGIDPSTGFDAGPYDYARGILKSNRTTSAERKIAIAKLATEAKARDDHAKLRAEFMALPGPYQSMFREVAKTYEQMADQFEEAVLENIQKAAKVAIKRAERAHRVEMARITDDGLKGQEKKDAIAAADDKLARAKARGGWAMRSRINSLRAQFESNRLTGPYFPLVRFGKYFMTLRDKSGKVVSFSRFETQAEQKAALAEAKKDNPEWDAQIGVMNESQNLKDSVDPTFVADIQALLGDYDADPGLMDAVWQRWLETLPDQSIRTSRIHRKGRAGYSTDALRAFTSHLFHGAHQMARLKYGTDLGEALAEAEEEAAVASDPNRAGLVVNELARRHEFVMNPTGGPLAANLSTLNFIWYLGISPAAAIANLSQTTVMGPAIIGARFPKQGATGTLKQLGIAMRDVGKTFLTDAKLSKRLTVEERSAIEEAERRGIIDRTQGHDLASVAETGVEYNPTRERVMRIIAMPFHKAEVLNRTATFLAAYRMAKEAGQDSDIAINTAADLTWKIHFDYSNTSKPRLLQNDFMKVLLSFRQFSINSLFRLFRDVHQSINAESPSLKREARAQLVGISLSMMAHAGIRGVWGYALITTLLGMFFPGMDDDDIDRFLQKGLLMDGESPGAMAWNYVIGMAVNGIPGQITGTELSERMGMPSLWLRDSGRNEDPEEWMTSFITDMLGPTAGILTGFARGAQLASDGEWLRATEAATPKSVRDLLKGYRYATEGVTTLSGADVLPDPNLTVSLRQAMGFTPLNVSLQYAENNRLMNDQNAIQGRRSAILKEVAGAMVEGEQISEAAMDRLRAFNQEFPTYAIDGDSIQQSARSRMRARDRNETGVALNPRLNDMLRAEENRSVFGP